MMMILMRVDVNLHSCGLKLEVHCLRYLMQCSSIYSGWEFRHIHYILYGCAWTFYVVATELWLYICSCKDKMDIYFIDVRMLQHCRIKTENVFQCVLFMYYDSYHKRSIQMMVKKFSWSFRRNLPEVNVCMWEFGISHITYIELLGTICDYVIWWELRMLYQSVNR